VAYERVKPTYKRHTHTHTTHTRTRCKFSWAFLITIGLYCDHLGYDKIQTCDLKRNTKLVVSGSKCVQNEAGKDFGYLCKKMHVVMIHKNII